MTKAEQLHIQLKDLDSSLIPGSSRNEASPVAPKIDEGNDRWGGFPPA